MPNHCENWIKITGTKAKIKKLVKDTKLDKDEFDFSGIVKMPEELENTISPTDIVKTKKEADAINVEHHKSWSKIDGEGYKTKAITETEARRRRKKYGGIDWYDWALTNWGTKWNAYDVDVIEIGEEHINLTFTTAWGPPDKLFDKLDEMGYTVSGYWREEGGEDGYIGDGDGVDVDIHVNVDFY